MKRQRRRLRRDPNRKPLREKIMSVLSLAGFLSGLLKYSVNIPEFIRSAEAFINAPLEEKWDKFKPVGDLLWPIVVDMTKMKAQELDLKALQADLEAQGFDGSRLKKIWEALSPLLVPLLLEYLKK